MFVTVIIPHETYGFGRLEPIVFEDHAEAEEYVKTRRHADDLDGTMLSYDVIICEVRSRKRRQAARARAEKRMQQRRDEIAHNTGTDSSPV